MSKTVVGEGAGIRRQLGKEGRLARRGGKKAVQRGGDKMAIWKMSKMVVAPDSIFTLIMATDTFPALS